MSRPLLLISATLGLAALETGARADDLPADLFASSPADSVLNLVVMPDEHPIVVRFRITVGGLGCRIAFDEFIVRLHAYLDADGDGRLSADEASRKSWAQVFADQPFAQGGRSVGRSDADGPDGDGFVSTGELGRLARELLGVNPLRISGGAPPDPRTQRPFEHIDRDGNGRLDADEIARSVERIGALDRDQDEWLALDEMNPYATNTRRYFGNRGIAADVPSEHPFVPLTPEVDRPDLAGRLLGRYDRDGDGRLGPVELGLPSDASDPVDASALAAWLDDPIPHLEFKVALPAPGRAQYRTPMTFERVFAVASVADRLNPASESPQVLKLGAMSIEFSAELGYSDYRDFLEQNFASADADKSDSIARSESPPGNLIGQLFDAADRDGDDLLTKSELSQYMDMYEAAFACRLAMGISDRGRSVYQAMDADDDGRLSLREVYETPGRLTSRDLDGDGSVVLDDFPRRYRFSLGLGPGGSSNQVFIAESPSGRNASRGAGTSPSWFGRMDRNGDGDVSRREFLGPLDLFAGLDGDGDGLVSAEEASRPVR